MNRFFAYLANLTAFQRARAGDVAGNFTLLETGLDLVAGELDRTLKCQANDPAIGPLPLQAVRANRALFFNANGDPVAQPLANVDDMAAAVVASQAAAASAASAAASLRSVRAARALAIINTLA